MGMPVATYRVFRVDELYHHGVKGQKWGIRRYQNADGTLTSAGKARYYNTDGSLTKAGRKWQLKQMRTYRREKMANYRSRQVGLSNDEKAEYAKHKKYLNDTENTQKFINDMYGRNGEKARKAHSEFYLDNDQIRSRYDSNHKVYSALNAAAAVNANVVKDRRKYSEQRISDLERKINSESRKRTDQALRDKYGNELVSELKKSDTRRGLVAAGASFAATAGVVVAMNRYTGR